MGYRNILIEAVYRASGKAVSTLDIPSELSLWAAAYVVEHPGADFRYYPLQDVISALNNRGWEAINTSDGERPNGHKCLRILCRKPD